MKTKIFTFLVCVFYFWSFIFNLSSSAQYLAIDPTRTIPNARVLGLGKAFIGLADDSGSMYTNPAGLVDAANWQLTSMSGRFLEEYSFLSFSGFYPTEIGVFGLGFAGTSISGAWSTTVESGSDPADPIYTVDYSQPEMGNQNNAFILSYANRLTGINYLKQLPFADRVSLGANLKLFDVKLYGDGIVGGDARGYELDLGMKFQPPQRWMKFGLTFQNLLPQSLGGALAYSANHIESYPVVVEGGSVFHLLGKEDAVYRMGEHELKLMLDFDMHPTLAGYPMAWHAAAEWLPVPLVALRAGIDQDAGDNGAGSLTVYSDLAYGVGLNLGGFRFDYAYHTFAGAPNIDNNYFSLSYGLIPPPIKAPEAFKIDNPPDKLVTFNSKVKVAGQVLDNDVRRLTINGVPLKFTLRGEFEIEVDLKEGKNAILLEGMDDKGERIAEKKLRILRLTSFPDVPESYWVAKPISLLAMQNIITGYPDGTFRPEGNINRAEMCTLLMKTKGASTRAREAGFTDVPSRHWASPFVAQAAEQGVVKGYPDGTFRPTNSINRAEGLAMIARFAGITEEVYGDEFPDVSFRHWAAQIISGAHKAGLLEFLKNKPFLPIRDLNRAETVEMLYRTQYVEDLLDRNILNWESY